MKGLLAAASWLLPLVSALVLPREAPVNYNGYKVFRVSTGDKLATVQQKLSTITGDQWNRDISQHIDISIAPSQLKAFQALGLQTTVMHEDLGADIAAELLPAPQPANTSSIQADPGLTWFNAYHAYADHEQYLKDVQALLPSNSELISSGTSAQGRNIYGIHIWGSGGKGSKPAVLFHSTVHAREWITTMVVEYIAYNLVTGYKSDKTVQAIVNAYDLYILPVVNPDGFVYTQTTNRLWRKNRQAAPSGSTCIGRDINRNWPYKWDANPNGASTDPCDETYKGQVAGDAPENQGLVRLVKTLQASKGIKLYIDWHSYGQYMLSPYGFDCSLLAANNQQLQSLASGTTNAITTRFGTKFTYGPSCSTLYATTGSSVDYLYDVAKTQYSYTIELRDKGNSGFVLPASQILPSAQEQWDGMKYLLTAM